MAPLAAGDTRRHPELARWQNVDLDPRKEALASLAIDSREVRVLRAVEAHGNEQRAGLVGTEAGALLDLHQRAGHRQAAFREDNGMAAFVDRLDEGFESERRRRIDREG